MTAATARLSVYLGHIVQAIARVQRETDRISEDM